MSSPYQIVLSGEEEAVLAARIRSALLADVSAETSGAIAWGVSAETREGQARALLADVLDWHRRQDKPAWWRYFYVRTLSPAELIGEPDALGGLTGGDVVGQVKKSVVRRFRFPAQEHKFSTGGTACDPDADKQWSVCDVNDARDDRPEDGQHLLRAVARGPSRSRAAQDLGATGSAAGSR
jgi:hypothetical protein